MIEDILNYISFLNTEYNLSISIHNGKRNASKVIDSLIPYNIHYNPYCLFIKSEIERHRLCIEFQQTLREKCSNDVFCETCPCGVRQYVIPITDEEELLGFICVGGYKGNIDIVRKYAEENDIPKKVILEKYKLHLEDNLHNETIIKTLVKPLCAMLTVLFRQNPDHNYKTEDNLYNHILSLIHAKAYKKITINDIAKACYCSPSFASRIFKRKSGTTINQYITSLRMKKAEKLLIESDMSITDIAYSCGFTDSNYFVAAFSKIHKMPPLKFRKNGKSW